MKRLILQFVWMSVVPFVAAVAQISVTNSDFVSRLTVGNALVSKGDTLTTSVNIGASGSTSWDFSALHSHTTSTLTSVALSSVPSQYNSQFPSATHVLRGTVTAYGITGIAYQYLILGTNLVNPGLIGDAAPQPILLKTRYVPNTTMYQLPFTLGTSWSSAYTETDSILLSGFPLQVTTSTHNVTNSVDAYGSLTLPGGVSYQALRIRTIDRSSSGGKLSYQIIAKNGASVQVTASDTLQPSSGMIQVSSVSWNAPIGSADVRLSGGVPAGFALMQNYPNPFNPSTTIEYQVASSGPVTLTVYNLLGQEVATLVNTSREPGTYSLQWNADGVPSGVYFYKLQTASFSATRRMILLR